jgi:hypothetical protein
LVERLDLERPCDQVPSARATRNGETMSDDPTPTPADPDAPAEPDDDDE